MNESESASAIPQPKVSFRLVGTFMLWLTIICGATVEMINYANTPGAATPAPIAWPKATSIARHQHRPTLVMFAHPHCPCTLASLGELERLLARAPGQLDVHVVFLKPATTPLDWEKTDLWRKASSIPGVTVHVDDAGTEARRFHAQTSGQTLLYNAAGQLRFEGGITLARGHAGDNPGENAVLQLLNGDAPNHAKTPVFGCSLAATQCSEGDVLCKP